MTEKEYRALEIDSYSSIKVFIEDRKKYFKEFVLKEAVRDKDTDSTIFGSLVDCLLFAPHEFEDRYVMGIAQPPTGQYLDFVKELMRFTVLSLDENGRVTRELEKMMEDAYGAVKFDRNGIAVAFKRDSFDVVKEKFIGTDLELYYRQLRDCYGKTLIEISDLERAQNVVNALRSNRNSRDIINLSSENTDGICEVFDQFPVIGYVPAKIIGSENHFSLKGLIDRLVINHEIKEIDIYDLKTAWDNEGEFATNYLKYKYYIQATIYYYLVIQWKNANGFSHYRVNFPSFIVAESSNYKEPLIYITDERNFKQGMKGFSLRGKYHIGVHKAITDLVWHKETGIWTISKDNSLNKGVVRIDPFFEQ